MKRGEFCGFFFPKEEEEFVRVIPDCEEAKHVYVSFLSKAVTLIDYARNDSFYIRLKRKVLPAFKNNTT